MVLFRVALIEGVEMAVEVDGMAVALVAEASSCSSASGTEAGMGSTAGFLEVWAGDGVRERLVEVVLWSIVVEVAESVSPLSAENALLVCMLAT